MVRIDLIGFAEDEKQIENKIHMILRDCGKIEGESYIICFDAQADQNGHKDPYLNMVSVSFESVVQILCAFKAKNFHQDVHIIAGSLAGLMIQASKFDHTVSKIENALAVKPLFNVGGRVQCHGYVGTVKEMQLIYHNRGEEWTWGYHVEWENESPAIILYYFPEGYLQNLVNAT